MVESGSGRVAFHNEEVVWPFVDTVEASIRSQFRSFPSLSQRSLFTEWSSRSRSGCLLLCRFRSQMPIHSRFCSCGVSTNVMVRGLDIAQGTLKRTGWRWLQMVHPFFQGVQLVLVGRYVGVCASWRRNAVEESRHQWIGFVVRSQVEGRQVPEIVWDGRKSQDGGFRRWSGRKMVQRNANLWVWTSAVLRLMTFWRFWAPCFLCVFTPHDILAIFGPSLSSPLTFHNVKNDGNLKNKSK